MLLRYEPRNPGDTLNIEGRILTAGDVFLVEDKSLAHAYIDSGDVVAVVSPKSSKPSQTHSPDRAERSPSTQSE